MAHQPSNIKFIDSQEAVFRNQCRDAVKRGPFTKSERDVLLVILNLWFVGRKKDGWVFHHGRQKIARRAGVSVRTVASTLALMRELGVMRVISHGKGGQRTATRYALDVVALFPACGFEYPAVFCGTLTVQNCTQSGAQIAQLYRAEIAHDKKNTLETATASEKVSGASHLRLIIGGAA